jgi:hypothetical protein
MDWGNNKNEYYATVPRGCGTVGTPGTRNLNMYLNINCLVKSRDTEWNRMKQLIRQYFYT